MVSLVGAFRNGVWRFRVVDISMGRAVFDAFPPMRIKLPHSEAGSPRKRAASCERRH
jgi:hypothetical protein